MSSARSNGLWRGDDGRRVMLELGDILRDLDDPVSMAFAAARLMGMQLGVSAAAYAIMQDDDVHIVVESDWSAGGGTRLSGTYVFEEYGSYVVNLRRGEDVVIPDVDADPRTRDQADSLRGIGIRSLINLPIIERGRFAACFFVVCDAPRNWSEDELGFVREIAERTRAEVERRRAERDLKALAASLETQVAERTRERDMIWQSSPDLLAVATLDGWFNEVNPAWTTTLGWSTEELTGKPFVDLIHPDDRARTAAAMAGHMRGEGCYDFENRYRTSTGDYRWFNWNSVPRDGMIYCVVRDVTKAHEREEALRAAEESLRQSQKMEAVGQLTGGLAHDFNNMLAGITGSLEIMQMRMAQGRLIDVERYIIAAQGAARRAAALTHRLLAFSRRQTLDPKATDINRLVADMEDMVRRTVGPSVEVEAVKVGGLWPTLIDQSQLENALLNLCINARDAMPGGGRIVIETANRWLDERGAAERDLEPGQYVSLCVSDNGTGMPPEVAAKAFDPFFTTKPLGEGTGLGLSMIYGFVRQSAGQVRIYSEPDQGTMVCLYLPRHGAEDEAGGVVGAPAAQAADGDGRTILVVDDEATIRMLVAEVLQDRGYATLEAADGAAAMRILNSNTAIDLLITDVGLPGGMNGRQLADAALASRPGLRALFITGYAENAALSHGHLGSGMRVLTKPFAMEALLARVDEMIERAS